MSARRPCQLFVYGTLRSDCGAAQADLIQQHFRLVGRGIVQGQLYQIDGYPGLVLSSSVTHVVKGELYELTGLLSVMQHLDEYEGCASNTPKPHEYRRQEIPVRLEQGGNAMAWAYLYNWPLQDRRLLENGDYAAVYGACGAN